MHTIDISILINVIGALVAFTNIITEVLKKLIWDMLPTNILAIAVAMTLTLVAFFGWTSYTSVDIVWRHVAAAVVIGFLVAYAAMFGFDKLKEILAKLQNNK